jgi:hypothetical protein
MDLSKRSFAPAFIHDFEDGRLSNGREAWSCADRILPGKPLLNADRENEKGSLLPEMESF